MLTDWVPPGMLGAPKSDFVYGWSFAHHQHEDYIPLACRELSVRNVNIFSQHSPTPTMATTSLVTTLRNLSSRDATIVLNKFSLAVFQDEYGVLHAAT